ncbi:DUF692 family multinuclear iron-containing protein, partial [Acidithiobacillus caldus]
VLVDTHSCPVWPEVWDLYARSLRMFDHRVPTLIEWDSDLPNLDILLGEAAEAQRLLENAHG